MAAETNGYISRGNMTLIMTAAGILMVAAGAFITQQNNDVDRRIAALDGIIKSSISREEHNEFKLRIDKDITRIEEQVLRSRAMVVPRAEHEARWASYEANQKLTSERLNEVRNLAASNSTVPLRDEMSRVQAEIADLRKLLLDRNAMGK